MTGRLLTALTVVFGALGAAAAPAQAADAPLGRLFFTPGQRSSLDVARTQRARTALSTDKTDEVSAAPVPQTLNYDGAVRRSDGKATVFLNGRALSEKDAAAGTVVVGRVRPDGGVSLQLPQSGRSIDLKPGQSVELLSGAIEEGYSRKPAQPESKPETKGEAKSSGAEPNASRSAPSSESAASGRSKDDEQRKVEEAMRTLQDAAKAASSPPPSVPSPSR